jgi:hypothetical protein
MMKKMTLAIIISQTIVVQIFYSYPKCMINMNIGMMIMIKDKDYSDFE